MLFPILAIISGLIILVWSADRFIDGAASLARFLGMSALLIGIIIVGFGTSAPEMIVSALSALNGNPGLALGNAYGSNIGNIALILGLTALIKPVIVNSLVLKQELPILTFVTLVSAYLIYDAEISHLDAIILLVIFAIYMAWSIWQSKRSVQDSFAEDVTTELEEKKTISVKLAVFWMITGLILLMGSSQLLVWGAVQIASQLGVSDLVIGLTIVAIGTSLPELAASIMAARKGEVDLAVGNIIGSNLFNTLAVVGIAGLISPIQVSNEIFTRDMLVMGGLTLSLFLFGYGSRQKNGSINRVEGGLLITSYIVYTYFLITTAL
ncbi:calcium/sodium antiporter [Histophilus somni]|uniref:Calcium/sodium antiporter n=1 Tax=Histophilus somni TaxID=731 RepID=A0A9Q6Z1Y0_HISSO|nr:calcium/sodium antiporter [Histophilus somni]ARU64699.1 calcium/sodium antiporter [Histophilus somni]ARU66564.1 calcium/sodium antiporter [Histophilus somni]ARU68438.1 calcium/sodium antiporter [Histophilus somni]ARU70317.1 calcium/sodium antiporter [Histophilus somni]ARU72192.1 calcium/sodium antiporter [Histophilus somni]